MLPEINTEKKYTVTSGVLSYSVPFPLYEKTDVSVVWSIGGGAETTLTLDSDYSVDIADTGESGTVTLVEGRVPVGATLALQSAVPETQELDLSHTSDVDTEALEKELDRQVQMIQQLHDEVDRSIRVPVTGDTTPEELQEQLFTARDEAQEAASAAQAAQAAAESCRDEACECASEAAATLENAVTVIKEQEQASVEVVKNEGDTQAKRLEDIATTILISAVSYNKSVSVKLTSPINNGETYTLPESMAYLVGRSQLYVSGNGVWFYKGFQYEEVGTDGVASTQIKFLQDLAVDDVLTFTLLANRVNMLTATNSGLVNDAEGYLKLNVDGQTVLINASGQVYVPVMTGATADKAGTAGLAPAADAGQQNKPLTGGGNYADSLDCDISGHASKDLPLSGGTVTGGIYPKKAQLPLGSKTNFWNIYAKYIEFITENGVSVGNINAFEYEGRHILGLYPNTDVGAQIHLGSDTQPLEKVHVNRLNGCWGNGLNVSIEKPAAIYQYGSWSDSYSGGWYVRLTNGVQIVAVAYANGATGQDVWIPFPVPFKDSSYASVCMPLAVSSNTMANAAVTNRQTTGCTFSTQFGSGIYNISVCGIFMGWF